MKYYRVLFLFLGIFNLVIGGFMFVAGILAESGPSPISWFFLSMAVMAFSLSYLYPQFTQKDERMKLIRQKATFFSLMAMLVYLGAFGILLSFGIIAVSASEIIYILSALLICTLFLSFVVYSKIY